MKREEIDIPIAIENLLASLFGQKSTYGLAGLRSLRTWKGEVRRIVRAIQRAIYVNVDSGDRFHKKWLLSLCEMADADIRSAKTIDRLNLLTIRFLAQVTFRLLGDMPNHWSKRIVNRSLDWRLDGNRKLIYTQTSAQKTRLIFHLSHDPRLKGRLKGLDVWLKLREFGGDASLFIEWFSKKFQSFYAELF